MTKDAGKKTLLNTDCQEALESRATALPRHQQGGGLSPVNHDCSPSAIRCQNADGSSREPEQSLEDQERRTTLPKTNPTTKTTTNNTTPYVNTTKTNSTHIQTFQRGTGCVPPRQTEHQSKTSSRSSSASPQQQKSDTHKNSPCNDEREGRHQTTAPPSATCSMNPDDPEDSPRVNSVDSGHGSDISQNQKSRILSVHNILHQNIQSIKRSSDLKREIIIDMLLENQDSIEFFLLTETWVHDPKDLRNWIRYNENACIKQNFTIENDIEKEVANYNARGAGTAIIYHKKWQPFLTKVYTLTGRATVLHFKRKKQDFLIGCIYAPQENKENKKTARKISKFINRILNNLPDSTMILLGGDFNAAPNPKMDRIIAHNQSPMIFSTDQKPESKLIKSLLNKYNPHQLTDVHRALNPDSRGMTHQVSTGLKYPSQSRIDLFLVNEPMISKIKKSTIFKTPIAPNLHHKCIALAMDLGFQTHSVYHLAKDPSPQIKLDNEVLTSLQKENFIKAVTDSLDETELGESVSVREQEIVYQKITQSLQSNAKLHLPIMQIKRTHIDKGRKLRRQSSLPKTLKIINRLIHKKRLDNHDLDLIASLVQEHPDFDNQTDEPKATLLALFDFLAKQNRKKFKKRIKTYMQNREKNFIHDQKRNIRNIFENKVEWDNLSYVRNGSEITTKPEEVKKEVLNYF